MSKLYLVLFLLFSFVFLVEAQYEDYQVDSIVIHKKYKQKTFKGLSNEIAQDFEDRKCLIRAFYIYVTYYMVYDKNIADENDYRSKWYASQEEIRKAEESDILKALRTKKGVCWHFGNLFARLCAEQGIEVELITGTRRTFDLPFALTPSHLWNAVEIDGEMKMIDCTINHSESYNKVDYDQFYLIDPETFIYSAIPVDPQKQYIEKPISYEAFQKLVWPHQMFNVLQLQELYPRYKQIVSKNEKPVNFKFKLENFRQIESLEIYVNNQFLKSIKVDKTQFMIPLSLRNLKAISIQAVTNKGGLKYNWYLLDYEII
jgi:transglutaminase/protease-like cytokinesis protein 3